MTGHLEFRILGPIEVAVDGQPLELGRPKQQAVLGLLLLRANTVVPLEHLVDEVWGEEPPAQAIASLQAYISHLRRLLEPDRPARAPARVLVSRAPGYRLVVADDDLDAARFEGLAGEGRRLLEAGEPGAAAATLERALALWRGDVLAGLLEARADRARLEELRLAAVEDRIAADLALGRHAAVVAELDRLIAGQPYRESLHGLRMLALYRSGRQAEALRTFQQVRRLLSDELGIDPSPQLDRLHRRILDQAGELELPARSAPAPVLTSDPHQLVGRASELAALRQALGSGRMMVISGEPGIGKTRLALEIEKLAGDATVAWGRCAEEPGAPPFWPWTQVLRELGLPEVVAPDGPPVVDVEAVRFRLCREITDLLCRHAADRPLLLILDDMHWADAGSLRLLTTLAGSLAGVPALVVVTYRATEQAALAGTLATLARLPVVDRLPLSGLDAGGVLRLMAARLGTTPDEGLAGVVHDRSGGNPFFVVELARLLGSRSHPQDQIPDGVRDVLRRRLSGLPEQTQATLLVAAVAGREFDLDVVRDVSGLDDDAALVAIEAALLSGLVIEEPAVGRFRFTHALVREAIYDDVSRIRRARLHARVAARLGDRGGAHWWLAAPVVGVPQALPHLIVAADRALAALAHEEAGEHLRHALDLLATEPTSAERTRSELDVHLRLGTLHAQLDGAWSPAGRAAVAKVRSLADSVGDGPVVVAAYRTLYEVAVARGEHAEARSLAERMIEAGGQAVAHLAMGRTLWCLGEPAAAKDHLLRALDLAAAPAGSPGSPGEAMPVEVTVRLQLVPVLDLLGERALADQHLDVAITRTRDAEPLVRAGVYTSAALISALRRDVTAARAHARTALELAGPLPAWFSYAAAVQAWVRALDGDPSGGAAALRTSLAEIRSRGARHLVGWALGLLAEATWLSGDQDESRRLLAEAETLVEQTGERMYAADLQRLRTRLSDGKSQPPRPIR